MIPKALQLLISELGRLPGIGPRSAERLALHLFLHDKTDAKRLGDALSSLHEQVVLCPECGALSEVSGCSLCKDFSRRKDILCVVERPVDVVPIERSGAFRGGYHVLGGKLSPVNGVGPEDLRIGKLVERVAVREEDGKPKVEELVMALGMDVESDATVYYIAKQVAAYGVRVSRLAQGLPAGASLEFADGVTLGKAIENRLVIE